MNWLTALANPKSYALRKMMYDFLKERYGRNDEIIQRLASALQTEADVQAFVRLMMDVYETGFMKAVEEQQSQLGKLGLKVKVVPPS